MSNFRDRLVDEKAQLEERAAKLQSFINDDSSAFNSLDPAQKSLLKVQLQAMLTYDRCLFERISLINEPVA